MTTESTPAASTNITEKPVAPETPLPALPPASLPSIVAPSEVAPPWVLKADYVILGLVLVLTFFLASFTASNSDVWLNLAIGKRISEGTLEFGVDPFSWASEAHDGKPAADWVHQSWLFSWLLFQLYQVIGGEGLVFGKALLIVAAIGFLSRIGWQESSRWFILIGLAMAALATSGRLALQPIVVSLLFLSITLYLLHRAGVFALRKDEAHPTCPRWLWALPPLFALWANLDHWFILGPMIVGLCWLASGLARLLKSEDVGCDRAGLVPGKTLGLVFGVGLLACLLNPFHVRAFQLPPELAYMLLTASDSVGLSLPDALVAGGRALKEVRRIDADLATWTISSLSAGYWREPQRGLNIAGLALYPLLLLGLLGFTLVSLIRGNTQAPTLHLGRFLIWLVFGVMGLALYRMIPFFVIVAAPLTALTLGEFLHWQQVSAAVAIGRRDRGLNLARFVTVPFLLLLLYLAWPGWLHGTTEFNSLRRVAWSIRPDPSQQQAALELKALKDKGECRNVFNTSFDLGNYLPWFAPDVKYGMDTRFSLYSQQAAAYAKARLALASPDKNDADWQTLFKARDIDQIALSNYLQSGMLLKFWLNSDQWRQRYIDSRNMLVSWRGPGESWPLDQMTMDMNRRAFGEVPLDQRAPLNGAPSPQTLTFGTLYADGVAPQPIGVSQFKMLQAQNDLQSILFHRSIKEGGPVDTISFVFFFGSLPLSMTGGGAVPTTVVFANNATMFQQRDAGPPALPILMVRAARRAVAENPHDPQAQNALVEANEFFLRKQEDHWINYNSRRGAHPAKLRDRLRQVQLGTGLYNAVQLAPDQFDANERLASFYLQSNLIDLALEHKQVAERGLEVLRSDPKINPKQLDATIKQYREKVSSLENAVKVRLSKWKENKANLPPLGQAAYAYQGRYQDLVNDQPVNLPLGLGKTALDIVLNLSPEKLNPDEQVSSIVLRFELLLAMGRADVVMENLKDERLRKVLDVSITAPYQLLAAGALGDYEAMDKAAAELEGLSAKAVRELRARCVPSMFVAPGLQSPFAISLALTLQASQTLGDLDAFHAQNNELCNVITLRGICALEVGDTKLAKEFFRAALDQADSAYGFSERSIAKRYDELLSEQKR